MTTIEEEALHEAAVTYVRSRFHPLEKRMRCDLAQQVLHLLENVNPEREFFQRGDLDLAEELARLTLLHSGEIHLSPPTANPTHVSTLLLQVRLIVREAQGTFGTTDSTMRAALMAFNQIVGLVSTCTRMAGDPPCARDGQCPEHGKDRPGQCVPSEGVGGRVPPPLSTQKSPGTPGSGVGQSGEER